MPQDGGLEALSGRYQHSDGQTGIDVQVLSKHGLAEMLRRRNTNSFKTSFPDPVNSSTD